MIKSRMKCLIICLFPLLSFTAYGQQIETKTLSTDRLILKRFNANQVVLLHLDEASICIRAKHYLTLLKGYRGGWGALLEAKGTRGLPTERSMSAIKTIDSLAVGIRNGLLTKDTIHISGPVVHSQALQSHWGIQGYIERGKCAVYDKSGHRVFAIVRKKIVEYMGNCGWQGTRYFVLEGKIPFLEILDAYIQRS